MDKKDENKRKDITEAVIDAFKPIHYDDILSDVNGSYTGVPIDGGEPVQDADDL